MFRDVDISQYWPVFLRESREYNALAAAHNAVFASFMRARADLENDLFVITATENGIQRWEAILSINPKGTDTLEVRRFRVLSRLCKQLPYTHRSLARQLASLCGDDGYSLMIRHHQYQVVVRVALTQRGQFDEVEKLLNKVLPANLILDLSLLYNTHGTLTGFTHAQLAAHTHHTIRNEVMS